MTTRNKMITLGTIIMLIGIMLMCGCRFFGKKEQKTKQEAIAQKAAASLSFTDNSEIENIKTRLELTAKPGLIGYILLLNEAGMPIYYTTTKGKVTSGGKRLTKTYKTKTVDCGQSYCDKVVPAPSDEGTYGKSNPYIYFWTQDSKFIQWNGKYLWSDQPFRLRIQPLVVEIKK